MKDDDIELFRRSINVDKKIIFDGVNPARKKLSTTPSQRTESDEYGCVTNDVFSENYDFSDLGIGDELLFHRPGVSRADFKKLRKGQVSIQGELDLHGLTVSIARQELIHYLHHCKQTGKRCVRIIHGKGHGSVHGKPVIKNRVNTWLRQQEEVLAFCSARQVDGGTGAIYLLLKKSRRISYKPSIPS